ncbi:dynein light chain binding protein [Aureococcus anophagefferens]|nr:dynein light chain binding protein [Aureococcus anophagefferens]
MALTQRHHWVVAKIVSAFEPDIDNIKVQGFVRQPANASKLLAFFNGEAADNKLFVFYQPPAVDQGDVDAEGWPGNEQPPELFFSQGSTTRLTTKCCVFVRAVPPGTAIDLTKQSTAELLYCELSGTALGSISTYLDSCFMPAFDSSEQWGKASEEQRSDFTTEMGHFISTVKEALSSLIGGLVLDKPTLTSPDVLNAKTFSQQAKQNPELIPHFEGLLEGWCNQIQAYLDEPTSKQTADDESEDVGPLKELDNWRNRMQRLTSIAEQLKRKDCKSVINLLQSVTKNSADPSKQKMMSLLRRWKQTDVNITEAANEAKDNVKYLFTLERFIEPLYKGTATTIIDTLPALTNSIKMIHTIARATTRRTSA